MEKVNASSSQKMPTWERGQASRGHRSAVDGALQAHRQRVNERMSRTEERLQTAREPQIDFFPKTQRTRAAQITLAPQIDKILNDIPSLSTATGLEKDVQIDVQESLPSKELFVPRQIDEIYGEAQFSSPAERALGLVDKDLRAPEDVTSDEVPKGSYVDYTV